jgi:hypothetical protein
MALILFYGNMESIKAKLSYRSGDFMIGVLLPVTTGHKCEQVEPRSVQLVETIIYAVQKINHNKKLHSNITIGYQIRDTCTDPTIAVREASKLVSGETENSSCVGNTRICQNEIIAVLGPHILENIILTAGSLNFYQFPQVRTNHFDTKCFLLCLRIHFFSFK